ncbi:transcriptional regulator YfiE [Escherichia coli]|uniref:Transcriptional regulator YfiE n=1 Tax=Escherichia coli TaxID=562 RepID=A0A377DN93_ECOLX|nr:transcriptional regulator YfiE [Escherichia coli]
MFLYSRFDIFDRLGLWICAVLLRLKPWWKRVPFASFAKIVLYTIDGDFSYSAAEQEFSVQLFEKIGRRMCLTREGKKLLPHIYELTRVMDTLREAAKKESDPDGELRVVSGETLLSYRMPQVLQRFRQRAPKVRLSLQSLNCYVIRDALLNDEADVGVFYRVGNDDALNRRGWVNNHWCWWLHRKLQMSILLSREDITPVALLSTNRNVSSGRY